MTYSPTTPTLQSPGNSTTVALTGGATFTGQWEQITSPDVMATIKTDSNCTLYFDFSPDGVNTDSTFPTAGFAVTDSINEFHTAVKGPRYFRVRLVNSAKAQSYLRLAVYYGSFRQPSAPLNQPLGLDADAILVRPTYPWMDISRGLVTGMSVVKKFGRNPSTGTSFVPVTVSGNFQTPQSGSATTLRIKSGGNANDTAAGSGAREVTIEGLDENFAYASEAIATNGASASSPTTTTFTRVNRAYVSKSGTYATIASSSQAATITIENGAGGTDWLAIDGTAYAKSQSEIGAYSVASGYTAYIFLIDVTIDAGKTADVVFFERDTINQTSAPYAAMRAKAVFTGLSTNNSNISGSTVPLGPFVGPCDLIFLAKLGSSGSVAVEFDIFLVQE